MRGEERSLGVSHIGNMRLIQKDAEKPSNQRTKDEGRKKTKNG